MANTPRPLPDADLERALAELAPRLALPRAPHLAAAVRARLAERPRQQRRRLSSGFAPRALALAAATAILVAAVILIASPDERSAVADWLGLKGAGIEYVPTVAPPTPAPALSATPEATGLRLSLGAPVSLTQARGQVTFPVAEPHVPELGPPDQVYLTRLIPGGQVALLYRPRPGIPQSNETGIGLLLTQFQGGLEPDFIGKGIGPGTKLERITVNGAPGFWIEGNPHMLLYRDARGRVRDDTLRLAGNTVLWEKEGVLLRLESALGKNDALRIAASVR